MHAQAKCKLINPRFLLQTEKKTINHMKRFKNDISYVFYKLYPMGTFCFPTPEFNPFTSVDYIQYLSKILKGEPY